MELKVVKKYSKKDMQDPDAVIKRMESSWQAAYRNTQVALVATLVDCYAHGDKPTAVSRANRIVEAITVGGNAKAVVEWLERMGFRSNEEGFVEAPERETIQELAGIGFVNARELMWWTLKPQSPFKGYTLRAVMEKAVADSNKYLGHVADGEVDAGLVDVDPALLKAMLDALGEEEG